VPNRIIRAVLSGSYHKDYLGLLDAYNELVTCGIQVLSPHRLDFEDTGVLFVRDKAEHSLSEEALERHHLMGIDQADFLWVHFPDQYVGVSSAFEIGYALAKGIPIFSNSVVNEPNLQPFIHSVPSVYRAIDYLEKTQQGAS